MSRVPEQHPPPGYPLRHPGRERPGRAGQLDHTARCANARAEGPKARVIPKSRAWRRPENGWQRSRWVVPAGPGPVRKSRGARREVVRKERPGGSRGRQLRRRM